MSRGKRYNGEQKLNMKKVFAVIITIIVIIMFFMGIKHILKKDPIVWNGNRQLLGEKILLQIALLKSHILQHMKMVNGVS